MTKMAEEIASIPEVVARQLDRALDLYLEQGERLRKLEPNCVVTCARGSSDHAALYFKYIVESTLGVPVCSMGPSIASIYDNQIRTENGALIAVSQSGGSKDLAALCSQAAASGLSTVALVNNTESLLARSAYEVLPVYADSEKSVAATKSFVCSLVALASIVAAWKEDIELVSAIKSLPEALERALKIDWMPQIGRLVKNKRLFVISRGPGYAIAEEAALKFKETCAVHAEAFSSAEVRHGPIALAVSEFSALCFLSRDKAAIGIEDTASHLHQAGAYVLKTTFSEQGDSNLRSVKAPHVLLDPICQITTFYLAIEKLSLSLGSNPDNPALLSKVTVTV
ncbi:SIS domain-containing protein [Roseibium porphyridii]|uniref:SIS domain-containing protein n=1 Tax=Roseibium porphyridii TaxID=2866279 RepID=A0ABY8F327_9HYPH|nr:SIS domain-containing protein [Roseibium sp. KMA01]WFE89876.1 SIS domain-containing protein [Roseibium sp. KMA01]